MSLANSPRFLWGYALETAAYILNRVPSKSIETTPYEIWSKKKPSFSYMKIWGCPAYVKRVTSDKLDAKYDKCLFVGYPKETIGYYFYHSLEHKIFVSKHAIFLEKEFLLKEDSGSHFDLNEVQNEQVDINQPIENVPESHNDEVTKETESTPILYRSSRTHIPIRRYDLLMTGNNDVLVIENDEPICYKEVLKSSESDKWLKAMRSEMDSMYENEVWTLVDPPEGIKPIGCK